ncbi:MAG: hypothetical protein AAF680_03320 [Pseudomonadota bacterium]
MNKEHVFRVGRYFLMSLLLSAAGPIAADEKVPFWKKIIPKKEEQVQEASVNKEFEEPKPPVEQTVAQDLAVAETTCVLAGQSDAAAAIALLFKGAEDDQSIAPSELARYLVGLCVPGDLTSQLALNQYLISKGANYSFYAERSLEALKDYLDEAGVELAIRTEAIENDRAFKKKLKKDNNIKKAGVIMDKGQSLMEEVELFAPAIAELKEEQRTEALALAAIARGHSVEASYFLSRGLYVSSKISKVLGLSLGQDAVELANDAKTAMQSMQDAASVFRKRAGGLFSKEGRAIASFTKFATTNGEALVDTLRNSMNVVSTFTVKVSDVPSLSEEEIAEDVARLSKEWSIPDVFAEEELYAETNVL